MDGNEINNNEVNNDQVSFEQPVAPAPEPAPVAEAPVEPTEPVQPVAPEVNPAPVAPTSQPAQPPRKKSPIKIILIVGGIVVVVFVALICFVLIKVLGSSNKLVCKSAEGNITIMYTDKEITGYTANGITYDLDGQKEVAKQIGIEEYLDEFEVWFSSNTTGTCERK